MTEPSVLFEIDQQVAIIRLNRPRQLNALTTELVSEWMLALDQAANDASVRAVLITGEGRGFCSGADLVAAMTRPPLDSRGRLDLGASLESTYNPLIRKLRGLPKPVIAAVNGMAAGAGCSIALMADLTLAGRSAQFLQAFVNIGLIPDAGGTWLLARTLGQQRAMGFAALGEAIGAEQALAWGLIWEVVDDDQLMPRALALAQRLAQGPTLAIARIKQALIAAQSNDLDAQLDLERDFQRELGLSHDFTEGAGAFVQKRKARFKGR
ncbi:MAG: enoyl-CoA hydratase-related protein [Panacagrimonas sp.]